MNLEEEKAADDKKTNENNKETKGRKVAQAVRKTKEGRKQ